MNRNPLFLAFLLPALAACTTGPGTDTGSAGVSASAPTALALDAYHWDLATAMDAQGQIIPALQPIDDRRLRMDFSQDRIAVSGGCNRMSGSYRQHDASLQVGALAQTQMACADRRLMALDAAIAQRLTGTLQAKATSGEPPRLELVAGNGDRLGFAGTPTPQTRYGNAGTTMFLEVAPQRIACPHPMIPNMQCLQVRERTYADNGTISSRGEWRPLYQDIEGYRHTPGTRNVLRVKRFTVNDPPADASSVAYVLDMVVESELVGR